MRQSHGYVSGEDLSARCGVTRAAVWKQIQKLRGMGYAIEGVPSTGYRLVAAPDSLDADEVLPGRTPERIGTRVLLLGETTSTNDDAWRLAREGAPEGSIVIAECQTGGKGRKGRLWISPKGVNLYTSIVLRPPLPPSQVSLLTLLAGVVVAEVIREDHGIEAGIKWPNDVLIGGKKVAGILSEMSAEADRVHFLVLGIGVNLNMTEEMFPPDLLQPATSLFLVTGTKVDRASFARSLYGRLDSWYSTFLARGGEPVREAWLALCVHRDRWLEVLTMSGRQAGRFAGLDDDGCLLLDTGGSVQTRIAAGDVVRSRQVSSPEPVSNEGGG